jgi:hypothetical protein
MKAFLRWLTLNSVPGAAVPEPGYGLLWAGLELGGRLGLADWAWETGPGRLGLGDWAWETGPGRLGLGDWAWETGTKRLGLGLGAGRRRGARNRGNRGSTY